MNIDFRNAKKCQTIKGWGTSSCWWSQYCCGSAADDIARLLYSSEGLGLNIYRYNIGGGTDADNCRISNPWRRTESMLVYDKESDDYSWDYTRDSTAVEMMKKCLSYGNIDTLILFCNSPHYSQCSTGQTSGSLLYSTCNIPLSQYRAFVDYVLDVAQHFIDDGLPVRYISPINEPQWKWGGSNVWQEGCHYEPDEVAIIFRLFADAIIDRGMHIKLYGPESGELLGRTAEYLEPLLADESIMKVLEVVGIHSYHSDDKPEDRYEFASKILPLCNGLRVDMSEWCELPNKSHVADFNGALITARIIGQDLSYAGFESWTSWVAVNQHSVKEDGHDYSDAMLTANDDFSVWSIAKRYYAMAHYSKYIPIGSVVLDLGLHPTADNNDFNVFGFLTPKGQYAAVIVNEGAANQVTLDGDFSAMTVIKSICGNELATGNEEFVSTLNIDAKSIYTVILDI